MLVIGILCVAVAGPVLTQAFSTWPAVPQSTQTVPESSDTDVVNAYTYHHQVISDNLLRIQITVADAYSEVRVRIYTEAIYNAMVTAHSDPDTVTGQYFVVSIPSYGSSPSANRYTSYTSNSYKSFEIDFGGDATGGTVIFVPGTYVVVIYGANSGTSTDIQFSLQITTDIFGRVWGRFVFTAGWIIIIVCAIVSILLATKKTTEGRM
jgi:hypothetical protein